MSHEQFNLDRHISLQNMIDPTGRKWTLHGSRGSSLVHARPEPDRTDAQIPKEFAGQWTSPTVLKERITVWLTAQWNKSDEIARLNALRAGRGEPEVAELPPVVQKTPEESLAELPDEIKEALGDVIQVATPEEIEEEMRQNADEEAELARSKMTGMSMDELRAIATPLGVKGTSKQVLINGINEARA